MPSHKTIPTKDIQRIMFVNIQDYYNFIENDKSLSYDYNVVKFLMKLRDKEDDPQKRLICSFEVFFMDYGVLDGEITYKTKFSNGETYPNFTLFKDDLSYIISRADAVTNPKYRAKYNHLLWQSPQKNNKYLIEAIDNYFLFIIEVALAHENTSEYEFESLLRTIFILSQKANYKKEEVIKYIISLTESGDLKDYHAYSIVKFISKNGKRLDSKIIQHFKTYADKVINENLSPDFLKEYLELQIFLCQKLRLSAKNYHNKLGELHVSKAEENSDSFIAHDYYLQALSEFHKAGNKKRLEEVSVLVEKAKKNINLKEIKYEHTDERLKEYWNTIIKITDELIEKYPSEDIYKYIISSKGIFPKAAELTKKNQPNILDFVSVINFDINKNVNKKNTDLLNPYSLYIQNFSINHLWIIFAKGIIAGKISYDSLIQYFEKFSWYNQTLSLPNYSDENEQFNWIELLSPPLSSYFSQIEVDIKTNKFKNHGYILSIDSLALKFEGLIREFSRFIGAQTIEIKEDETVERISFEKLLNNEKLKEIIPEDDIALFKFLFLSDYFDLRNNIAHCFYRPKNYSSGIMILLIAALLKLGNFELKPVE
jgi:hypothetical protein